jgi:Tol biopolymer transport system component
MVHRTVSGRCSPRPAATSRSGQGCGIAEGVECLDESNVYELDIKTHAMTLVTRAYQGSVGFGCGGDPAISADGTKVAFDSDGANLVRGDTNSANDVFVRNLTTGVTKRVSVTSKGAQTNGGLGRITMSADGSLIAFESDAWNIVPNDGNLVQDIFVRDMRSGKTTRASVSSSGGDADAFSGNAANRRGRERGRLRVGRRQSDRIGREHNHRYLRPITCLSEDRTLEGTRGQFI